MLAFIIRKPPSCILPPHIPDEPEICANSLPRLSGRGGAACEKGACATRGAEAETRFFLRSYGWECLPLRPEVHKPSACARSTRIGGARERAGPMDYINKV